MSGETSHQLVRREIEVEVFTPKTVKREIELKVFITAQQISVCRI